jgi:hypothetical protein
VAIHQILKELEIYPLNSFLRAKQYKLEVFQNRHTEVCKYINDATKAVHQEILSGTVKRIKVATHIQESWCEQFVFDITQLYQPDFETMMKEAGAEQNNPSVDAEEQLRGVLSRLKHHCRSLGPSNGQKAFSIIIEKDEGRMLDSVNEQQWVDIPRTRMDAGCHGGECAENMVKIGGVQAGGLVFTLWYEPVRTPSQQSTYTPDRSLESDRLTGSSSSDIFGTFPFTQDD